MAVAGWVVNDMIGMIDGSPTLWHRLLDWFPELVDQTNGYTDYQILADRVDRLKPIPDYIIRNATFFRPLRIQVPTAAFLQDVIYGSFRQMQIEVCRRAQIIVVNSRYTHEQYPELDDVRVVPIGVDANQFVPNPDDGYVGVPENAICFIGSGHAIKGFAHVERLIREAPDLHFCLIMKDETEIQIPGRVVTFKQVPHQQLARIINSCTVGFCPSIRETQHLAGIEMGFCGLPLITSDVGIYYRRQSGIWGCRVEPHEYAQALRAAIACRRDRARIRDYWRAEGFTLECCHAAWHAIVEELCAIGSRSPADVSSIVRGTG